MVNSLSQIQAETLLAETIDAWGTVDLEEFSHKKLAIDSPNQPTVYLLPGQQIAVGRSNASQLRAPHDNLMSRCHFLIEYSQVGAILRDLGSTNGTYVNFKTVKETRLSQGDTIIAGMTVFQIRLVSS